MKSVPADSADARALLTQYFDDRALSFTGGSYRAVYPRADAFREPDGVFLVVYTDDDRPSGCGGIRRIAPGINGERFEVKHLFTTQDVRGKGAGTALMAELEARARVFGAGELVLDTHHTLVAAAALYDRCGFSAIAAYNDNPNATRWYAKVL